jgi:hypothetical protein
MGSDKVYHVSFLYYDDKDRECSGEYLSIASNSTEAIDKVSDSMMLNGIEIFSCTTGRKVYNSVEEFYKFNKLSNKLSVVK